MKPIKFLNIKKENNDYKKILLENKKNHKFKSIYFR